jgi:hypothetical protein
LNPVTATIAETPETSDYTSIKQRVDQVATSGQTAQSEAAKGGSVAGSQTAAGLEESRGCVRSKTTAGWILPVKA